jgi:hypothetical protein
MFVLVASFALTGTAMIVWFYWPTLRDALAESWKKVRNLEPRHAVKVLYRLTVTHRARMRLLANVHDIATSLDVSHSALECAIYDYDYCINLRQQGNSTEAWNRVGEMTAFYDDDTFSLAACAALLHRGVLWGRLAGSTYDFLQALCIEFEFEGELTAFLSRIERRSPYLERNA